VGRRLILFGSPAAVIATTVVVWVAVPAFAAQPGTASPGPLGNSLAQRETLAANRHVSAAVKQERVAEARDAARLKLERVTKARLIAARVKQERVAEARYAARLKHERAAEARDRG
jgi:hypothetical protein